MHVNDACDKNREFSTLIAIVGHVHSWKKVDYLSECSLGIKSLSKYMCNTVYEQSKTTLGGSPTNAV